MAMQKELLDALKGTSGALVDYFAQGYTLGPLLGNSQEAQEAAYTVAYRLYRQAKYESAERLFAFLLLNDHLDRRYYLGYAACAQMQRQHERALRYYSMAHLLDKADPRTPMHMGECFMALGDFEKARALLSYALIQARHHAEHRAQVPRIEALMASLDRAEKSDSEPPTGGPHPSVTPES
jgi:type III secretion system low calcium response chaperone LcrH/SycD